MTKTQMVHLHVHTDFSMLDGMGTVPQYVARAKALGMPALAQTDHGNIAGSHEFYSECRKAEIEPILGCEFYFVRNAESVKEDQEAERFHTTFLAKDEAGFEILSALSTASHHQYYYKPLLDVSLIEALSKKDRKSLVVLSGCAGSIISRSLMGGIEDDPHEQLMWWKKMFPNFYIELMHHNTEFDRKLNKRLLKAAAKHDLPWVITNDPHYVMKDEDCHHDALLTIQTGARLDDEVRFRFEGDGYYLKSAKEMERAFRKYGEDVVRPGMAHTVSIAKECKTRIKAWDTRTWHIPKFPGVDDADAELRRRAKAGLKTVRLDSKIDKQVYVDRMERELAAFKEQGMADFLLVTADIADEARKRKIRMGPGRGSVCGTLVGYLTGIHKIDSVKYGLLFERFLNPERPKMPDIDSDFPPSRRPEMFSYVDDKYGAENTMRVGAYQRMKLKGTWAKLSKAYGIPFQTANKLSKGILEDEEGNALLPDGINETYPDLFATLMALLGLKTVVARHAAGVIIFDPKDPIRKLIPEMRISDESGTKKVIDYVSQFDLVAAGDIGLLKQDFLSLRTLDTIQECIDLVKARHGIDFEPDDWVPGEEPDDDKVWKMLKDGKTAGVFQMEGGANHRGIQEIKCGEFEDIVSCTSLYRAGPMIAGAPKRFLQNKKDKKVRVAHKSLEKYMEASWGEMIYQEQMFEILRDAAGFSWARVDDAKTAMARKDPVKMAQLGAEAIEGFRKISGMSEEKATEVWMQIQAQAAYLFNRSHAVAYSMLTYQTARLKYLYPLEFLAALLRTVDPKSKMAKDKRESYMTEAITMDFKIMPPDVNVSDAKFMPNGDNELLFGLQDIKGVGAVAVNRLVTFRDKQKKKIKKPEEISPIINNSGVMGALAAAGALRSLGVDPDTEKQEELLSWQFEDRMKPFREKYGKRIVLPKNKDGRVNLIGEIIRTEKRKTKTNKNFMTWVIRYAPGEEFKVSIWEDAEELFPLMKGSVVLVEGRWSNAYSNVGISNPDDVSIIKRVTAKTIAKAAKEKKA